MRRPRPDPMIGIVVVAVLLIASACESDETNTDDGAAEPALAPKLTTEPAGTVTEVGPLPQGAAYDPATDTLAVAIREPYRLLLLDPATLEQRDAVPLPGKARHLQVIPQGGTVLVPSESANALVQVNTRTGRVRSTDVEEYPHDAAGASNGDVVVGNEFAGSLSVVRDGRVVHVFDDLTQPGGVVVDGRVAVVVDVEDFTVTSYDLRTLTRAARVPAGAGPTHVALVGDNRIAVVDTRGDELLWYSVDPLRRIARTALEGGPYGLAGDPSTGTAWVTLTEANELVGVQLTRDVPAVLATYPTVRQPDTVAVEPGGRTLWVTGTVGGELQRIER